MSNLTFSPVLFESAAPRESASIQVVFVTAAPTIIPPRNKKKIVHIKLVCTQHNLCVDVEMDEKLMLSDVVFRACLKKPMFSKDCQILKVRKTVSIKLSDSVIN